MWTGSTRWWVAVLVCAAAALAGCSGGEAPVEAEALEQAQAIAATTPQPAGPTCTKGGLVDADFRDAALVMLSQLVVHAPGQAAHGAIKMHTSPGLYDTYGQAWHFIQAYQVNLAMSEALRVSPGLAPVAANWLRWQARHIRTTRWRQGVVFDHWVRASDLRVMECPPGGPAKRCPDVDSYDSTAASMLMMADSYLAATGDAALLREPAVRSALNATSNAMYALAQADGLTWAKPDYRTAYVMDAVEVSTGWRAWSRVQARAYGDAAASQASLTQAQRTEDGARQRLWHASSKRWLVAADEAPPEFSRWYPDTVAQAWPLLWSVRGPAADDAAAAWRQAAARWTGQLDWSQRNVDPDGFWWPAVAVAAHCVGDTDRARAWVARARSAWTRATDPFDWPFYVGDLRWLFWMADPR